MKKKHRKGGSKHGKNKSPALPAGFEDMPLDEMEGFDFSDIPEDLLNGFAGMMDQFNEDPVAASLQMVELAIQSDDPDEAVLLATMALQLNPKCVEAMVVMAHHGFTEPEEKIEFLEKAIPFAQAELGPEFEKSRGQFWTKVETRPYMALRSMLADVLTDLGRLEEAAGHYEELIELNPKDDQKHRYVLMGIFLRLELLESARRLFKQFADDPSAIIAWLKVLERLRTGDEPGAVQVLAEARKANPFVEEYLIGRRKMPLEIPELYEPGGRDEASICILETGQAWASHPSALVWLQLH